MKVLFFGIFDPQYSRNRVLRRGFEDLGWRVDECRVDPTKDRGIHKYVTLARLGLKARKEPHDLVIVCFPGHPVVWLARLLFGRAIIFDAFLSLYDSNVFDRKVHAPGSFAARKDFFLDRWSARMASRVLLDTNQHINYFVSTFGSTREKFIRVFVGTDNTVFTSRETPANARCIVHFHGTFTPLQGVPYIIEAAALLKDEGIHFRIIGSGPASARVAALIKEHDLGSVIETSPRVPFEKLADFMTEADIVLGIFGDTAKAQRVIPNKVYEAMAMQKAIITADTPAIRELPDAENMFRLVPAADAQALAAAIKDLASKPLERTRLAAHAYECFTKHLTPRRIVEQLLHDLEKKVTI